jgi:hypothetical protein
MHKDLMLFWVLALYSFIGQCQRFEETCRLLQHSIELGHQIKFKDTEVLAKTAEHMDRLVKEAINIQSGRIQIKPSMEACPHYITKQSPDSFNDIR